MTGRLLTLAGLALWVMVIGWIGSAYAAEGEGYSPDYAEGYKHGHRHGVAMCKLSAYLVTCRDIGAGNACCAMLPGCAESCRNTEYAYRYELDECRAGCVAAFDACLDAATGQ